MLERVVTMLAILAITVVTTVTRVRDTHGMFGVDHAMHVADMMHLRSFRASTVTLEALWIGRCRDVRVRMRILPS